MSNIPEYRLLQKAYVQPAGAPEPSLHEVGAIVRLSGPPPLNAAPLNPTARAEYLAMLESYGPRRGHQAIMVANALGRPGLDAYAAEKFIEETGKRK